MRLGDYDNDGFEDVFLYRWEAQLFHNDGAQSFYERQRKTEFFKSWVNPTAICF